MKKIIILGASVCTLFFVSCASTPQKRIEKHPVSYSKLSTEEKAKVEQGRIEQGMSKDAVFLAFGKPGRVSYGSKDGQEYEQWDYVGSEPIFTHNIGGFYGRGFGRYGRRGFGHFGNFGFSPSITYVPRIHSIVRFVDDRVIEFKATRGSLR